MFWAVCWLVLLRLNCQVVLMYCIYFAHHSHVWHQPSMVQCGMAHDWTFHREWKMHSRCIWSGSKFYIFRNDSNWTDHIRMLHVPKIHPSALFLLFSVLITHLVHMNVNEKDLMVLDARCTNANVQQLSQSRSWHWLCLEFSTLLLEFCTKVNSDNLFVFQVVALE